MSQTKITKSARGQDCQIRLPGICTFDPEQTVWCHSNTYGSGKSARKKGRDILGAYGCYRCHMVVDGQHPRPKEMSAEYVKLAFHEAHERSLVILEDKGLIQVA